MTATAHQPCFPIQGLHIMLGMMPCDQHWLQLGCPTFLARGCPFQPDTLPVTTQALAQGQNSHFMAVHKPECLGAVPV